MAQVKLHVYMYKIRLACLPNSIGLQFTGDVMHFSYALLTLRATSHNCVKKSTFIFMHVSSITKDASAVPR